MISLHTIQNIPQNFLLAAAALLAYNGHNSRTFRILDGKLQRRATGGDWYNFDNGTQIAYIRDGTVVQRLRTEGDVWMAEARKAFIQ